VKIDVWRRRLAGAGVLTALAVALVVIPAGPAAATGHSLTGLEVVEDTSLHDDDERKTALAECTGSKVVIGVGWSISGGLDDILIEDAIPYSDSVLVVANADETGHPDDWSVTAKAICADAPPGWQIVSDSITSTSNKTPIAFCPDDKFVIGVGFDLAGATGQMLMTDLNPSLDSVSVTAYPDDTGTANLNWTARSYAVCAYEINGLQIVASSNQTAHPRTVEAAVCPAGKVAIGAGAWFSLGEGNLNLAALTVFAFGGSQIGQATGHEDEDGTSANWDLTTETLCVYT